MIRPKETVLKLEKFMINQRTSIPPQYGLVEFTVLSHLLIGTYRILEILRMYVVVFTHVFPLQANLVYSNNVDTKLFGGNYDRNKKRLAAVRENEDHIFSQRASRIYDA